MKIFGLIKAEIDDIITTLSLDNKRSKRKPVTIDAIGFKTNLRKNITFKDMVREIDSVFRSSGQNELMIKNNPEAAKQKEKMLEEQKYRMILSAAAAGITLLAKSYPSLKLLAIASVFYVSKDVFSMLRSDIKRGQFFSVYWIGLLVTLGMVFTGQLFLATITGLINGFFARLTNRLEENAQNDLIAEFADIPDRAWVKKEGIERHINTSELSAQDIIVVHTGEVIPIDGVVISGAGQVDQHILTGESNMVECQAGDEVFASTLLVNGNIEIRVSDSGQQTVYAKIEESFRRTEEYNQNVMNRGRKIANKFMPVTIGLSAITVPILGVKSALAVFTSEIGVSLASAGPLTVLVYLQILAKNKILVKDGTVFETISELDTIVFDKTGTLTLNNFSVKNIHCMTSYTEQDVLEYACIAEYRQNHPIANAILEHAKHLGLEPLKPDQSSYNIGLGISVEINGKTICVGSHNFFNNESIDIPHQLCMGEDSSSASIVYIAIDHEIIGAISLEPIIKPEAKEVIEYFKSRGLNVVMISGDGEVPAKQLAGQLGIDTCYYETLPHQKSDIIKGLIEEGRSVCYVGDGINDSIALKSSQVSVSFRSASNVAKNAAQILIMDEQLSSLTKLFHLSDEFENTMRKNIMLTMLPGALTVGGVYLAGFGVGTGLTIFYSSCVAGLAIITWPLIKYQDQDNNPDNKLQ